MRDKHLLDPQVKSDNPLNKDSGDFEGKREGILDNVELTAKVVNIDASVPPRQAILGRPPRRAHRGGSGEDGSSGVQQTGADDADVDKAERIVSEGPEEEGEERGGRRGDGGADFCSPPTLFVDILPLTP